MEMQFGYFVSAMVGVIYFIIIHFLLYRVRLKYSYGLILPLLLIGVLLILLFIMPGGWEKIAYIIFLIIISLALVGYLLSWLLVFVVGQLRKNRG